MTCKLKNIKRKYYFYAFSLCSKLFLFGVANNVVVSKYHKEMFAPLSDPTYSISNAKYKQLNSLKGKDKF